MCRATTYFSSALIVLIGSFFLSYGRGAELLNFGALIAFMGVNAAALIRYFVRADEKKDLESAAAAAGISNLPGTVAEPEWAGDDRRQRSG